MREVGIDLSGRKPKRLTVEMQLHADWAVTMGCGDVCPYVPTRVDDWDIPDPGGKSLEEVREIRDMIAKRVGELARDRIEEIQSDRTSHQWRLAKLLPSLIEEFGQTDRPRSSGVALTASWTSTTTSRSAATSSRSRTSAPASASATTPARSWRCRRLTCERVGASRCHRRQRRGDQRRAPRARIALSFDHNACSRYTSAATAGTATSTSTVVTAAASFAGASSRAT